LLKKGYTIASLNKTNFFLYKIFADQQIHLSKVLLNFLVILLHKRKDIFKVS